MATICLFESACVSKHMRPYVRCMSRLGIRIFVNNGTWLAQCYINRQTGFVTKIELNAFLNQAKEKAKFLIKVSFLFSRLVEKRINFVRINL